MLAKKRWEDGWRSASLSVAANTLVELAEQQCVCVCAESEGVSVAVRRSCQLEVRTPYLMFGVTVPEPPSTLLL